MHSVSFFTHAACSIASFAFHQICFLLLWSTATAIIVVFRMLHFLCTWKGLENITFSSPKSKAELFELVFALVLLESSLVRTCICHFTEGHNLCCTVVFKQTNEEYLSNWNYCTSIWLENTINLASHLARLSSTTLVTTVACAACWVES